MRKEKKKNGLRHVDMFPLLCTRIRKFENDKRNLKFHAEKYKYESELDEWENGHPNTHIFNFSYDFPFKNAVKIIRAFFF